MLRRLAGQARAFSNSLLEHAAERRSAGERRHDYPDRAMVACAADE